MHTSGGSGYCDCGDPEAFVEFPVCSIHAPNEEQKAMMDKTIPKELHNHLHNLALIALKFITDFLCLTNAESDEALSSLFDCRTLPNKYQTILFNDETHTYDVVIRALIFSIECEESEAMRLASTVDREGRTVVCFGNKDKCDAIKENVQRRTQRDINRRTQRSGPLEVKVLRSSLVSCQHFAVRLIGWLTNQVKIFPPFATIIGNILLHECSEFCRLNPQDEDDSTTIAIPTVDYDTNSITPACGHNSPCLQMVLADRSLWKSARLTYHQFLMSTVLMHLEQKRSFGRLMIENYDSIYNHFVDDDHEHRFSIISMSVQVFTVPTIARFLVREHNAFESIVRYQQDFMQKYVRHPTHALPVLDFTGSEYPAVLDRSLHSMTDLGYLLSVTPKRHEWDAELRKSYLLGATKFLRFLRDFQSMDAVKRQFTDHQLTDSEWETAFNIIIRIEETLFMITQWALVDENVHMNLLTRCMLEIVNQTDNMQEFQQRRNVTVNGATASCIEYDISQQHVSIHQPLWRFAAALLTASQEIMSNYVCADEADEESPPSITANTKDCYWEPVDEVGKRNLSTFCVRLMEMPLRCIVLRAQTNANLWRRNGFSLDHQLHYYSNQCRSEMFDRDILLLQAVAALSDPDQFLIRVLDRYSLTRWATFGFEDLSNARFTETTPSTPSATQEDLSHITVTLAEEMLHLVIILLMERYVPGVGQVTANEALKREVLHILCTGPKPFSQLERYIIRATYYRKELVQDAVSAVGDFRRPPGSTAMGVFLLKPEFRPQYNPFFYHFQKVQQSAAEQCQKKDRANDTREIKACPPPACPKFEPFFAPIVRLAESKLLVQIISMNFDRYLKSSRFSSEGLLHRALFLCGIALNEQLRIENERDEAFAHQRQAPERFRFIEHAEELKLLDKHLVWWTIQRYKEAQMRYHNGNVGVLSSEKSQEVDETEKSNKSEKAEIAARKRQQAMERMKRLQKSFKNQHKELMDDEPQTSSAHQEHEDGFMDIDAKNTSSQVDIPLEVDDEPESGVLPENSGFPVCLGANRSVARLKAMRNVTCALCQENEVLTFESTPGIVCAAYVESNRLFAQELLPPHSSTQETSRNEDYRYPAPADLNWGTNVSTCAHTMHYSCYRTYVEGLMQRERSRQRQNLTPKTVNYERHEYLCPLCRAICNSALPLLPVSSLLQGVETFSSSRKNIDEEFPDWVQRMTELCLVPLYSTNNGENPKEIKSHARKRSHSERSLAEYVKESAKEPTTPLSISNIPQIGSSIASFLNLTGSPQNSPSHRTNSPHSSSNESTPFRGTDTFASFFQETLTKLKSILPNKQHKLYAPNNFTAWDTVLPFFSSLRINRMDPVVSDEIIEMLGVYSSTGYVLRSICAVLKIENKPLFGAFNTRQHDCINGMVRMCSIAAFTAKPMSLRLLASRFLSPFIVPLSANRPVPSQVYPARTLNNSSEIRRVVRNSQLRRSVIDPNTSSMNDVTTTSISSSSSTAPATPGPSSSQRQLSPQQAPSTSTQAAKPNPFIEFNILNIDMISMAIQLAMLCGWSWVKHRQYFHNLGKVDEGAPKIPDGSVDEHHSVKLALLAHLFQAFACHKPKENLNDDINRIHLSNQNESSLHVKENAAELDDRLKFLFSLACGNDAAFDIRQLKKSVHGSALEFMRSIAVFYNALTLVPPPEALKDPSLDEFEPLCRYLALPIGLKALLEGECVERLFSMWSSYVRLPGAQVNVIRPMKPRLLIDLPDDYSELINKAARFRCPAIKSNELTGPITTMCLLCGELLCSQSYCCQKTFNHESVGSCSYHMLHCGGNSGIFLRIRECNLVFLTSSKRGCHKAAPYVDEFGETDQGFRRGNPLYLNRELYKKYQRLWLHQNVTEEVVNQYEINYRNIGFDWGVF
ncbi:E3 ubiquitin-protein ligase [Aphelenchoides bicaudatus]|nr:E3 ubiquitin-protein ligase [Aphelenchoides bicaudatus]